MAKTTTWNGPRDPGKTTSPTTRKPKDMSSILNNSPDDDIAYR